MLHALYIIAFTALTVLAVSNLIRNLMVLGVDARRPDKKSSFAGGNASSGRQQATPHPEMLDDTGRVVDEPLLVMRSISIEDARERLDALFEGPENTSDED
ncbi:MAG: DUF2973 domain-containing protein [Cyanobacteria bacterium J06636_28]